MACESEAKKIADAEQLTEAKRIAERSLPDHPRHVHAGYEMNDGTVMIDESSARNRCEQAIQKFARTVAEKMRREAKIVLVGSYTDASYNRGIECVQVGHNCDVCRTNHAKLDWRHKLLAPDPFAQEPVEA